MPDRQVNLHIDLGGLRNELGRSLQKTIYFVAAGLRSVTALGLECPSLPTRITLDLCPPLKWGDHIGVEQYEEWILCNGFRDAIESIALLLEQTHRVLTLWDSLDIDGGCRITGAVLNEIFAVDPSFHRYGLPDKIDHLRHDHKLNLDEALCTHLKRINAARNCIVHRAGIVSTRDLTSEADMTITWRRMHFFLQDEDGEKPIVFGEPVEKDSDVCMRFEDIAKSFALGSSIKFSVGEFSEACWSLCLFGENLVHQMDQLGLERGLLRPA